MKTRNRKPGLIIRLLLLTLSACGLYGRGLSVISGHPGKEPHRVPKVGGRIRVDGILDEEVWRQALKLELKYEVRPGENIPAPVRTEVFLAHGNTAFYIGFRAHDPDPSSIRATFTDRDKITTDDWVSISLDTFNDQRRIYTFFCNPLGVQKDLVEVTGESNLSWDTLRRSAGRIAQPGYIVEMSIPFRSLRFQREKGEQVWGFDVMRGYPRNLEHLIGFIPLDRNNTCYICQLGKMIGFAGFDTYWRFTPRKLVNIQFLGSRTRYPRETAFLEVQPSGSLTLQFYTIVGNQIDFANRRQGRQIFLNPGVIYKAGRHFSISPDHIFERFDVDPGRLYTANVSNLLAVYQFNRRTFLRTILQYVNYDYNAGNYNFLIDPKFKHLFTQVMFSYKVNPQTVLFLGYSDDHFGSLHTPLTQANHTFFLKIGYAPVL